MSFYSNVFRCSSVCHHLSGCKKLPLNDQSWRGIAKLADLDSSNILSSLHWIAINHSMKNIQRTLSRWNISTPKVRHKSHQKEFLRASLSFHNVTNLDSLSLNLNIAFHCWYNFTLHYVTLRLYHIPLNAITAILITMCISWLLGLKDGIHFLLSK